MCGNLEHYVSATEKVQKVQAKEYEKILKVSCGKLRYPAIYWNGYLLGYRLGRLSHRQLRKHTTLIQAREELRLCLKTYGRTLRLENLPLIHHQFWLVADT